MEVFQNKKSDADISGEIIHMKQLLENKKYKNEIEKVRITAIYTTLKWVIGKENEK